RGRHTRSYGDWSSDVCSSDLQRVAGADEVAAVIVDVLGVGLGLAVGRFDGPAHLVEDRVAAVVLGVDDAGELVVGVGVGGLEVRSEERRVGKEGINGWAKAQI